LAAHAFYITRSGHLALTPVRAEPASFAEEYMAALKKD
jgi:hypothetical protein